MGGVWLYLTALAIVLPGYRFHRKACNYRDRLERLEGGPCPCFPECNCGSDDLPASCAQLKRWNKNALAA